MGTSLDQYLEYIFASRENFEKAIFEVENAEERNWTILKLAKGRDFQERLNAFFEDHPEKEDLLSFIEDALLEDEDSPVTAEGREPLFVSLKTVIDCLLEPHL